MNSSIDRIDQFWHWFENASAEIVSAYVHQNHQWLSENLTPNVRAIKSTQDPPRLNWEIGPGRNRDWQFVLSPTTQANLDITERAASRAPDLPDWEWHAWKPPKTENALELVIADGSGSTVVIDASTWTFKLRSTGNGTLGVLFVAPSISDLDDIGRRRAAYLILDNLLGERLVIERFTEATLVQKNQIPEALETLPVSWLTQEAIQNTVGQSH